MKERCLVFVVAWSVSFGISIVGICSMFAMIDISFQLVQRFNVVLHGVVSLSLNGVM